MSMLLLPVVVERPATGRGAAGPKYK